MPTLIDASRPLTNRVVLLLDLDCFYAQSECRRLGFDSQTTPLALLQWNSVLAVTYPAREQFGIRRGDGWPEVAAKSRGQCHAVHVPILTTASVQQTDAPDEETADESLAAEYRRIFELSPEQQEQVRAKELGVRRFSHEGKANIDCYRVASARIFATVLAWLAEHCPSAVLERASIDEFFIEVTEACRPVDGDPAATEHALQQTKVLGEGADRTADSALRMGCRIARDIRQAVYDQLGFTMTAGISCNKTLAKLSAGHGKPNGQAVTFGSDIDHLLGLTEIRSCRNLGGKLGKRVQALLPAGAPTTVAAIADHLSLPQLEQALGVESAQWVYDLAHGIDREAVVAKNSSAVTKSITAFKSLPPKIGGHSLEDCRDWIRLLADEVVGRIERDAARNHRYPRSCNIQYYRQASTESKRSHQNNKSARIAFPSERLTKEQKVQELLRLIPEAIEAKEGKNFSVDRIGMCAENFVARVSPSQAIERFFTAKTLSDSPTSLVDSKPKAIEEESVSTQDDADLEAARKLQSTYDAENRLLQAQEESKSRRKVPALQKQLNQKELSDFELAKRLQADYDRELRVLQAFDKREKADKAHSRPSKTRRIDTFFTKR